MEIRGINWHHTQGIGILIFYRLMPQVVICNGLTHSQCLHFLPSENYKNYVSQERNQEILEMYVY